MLLTRFHDNTVDIWDDDQASSYDSLLCCEELQQKLQCAISLIDTNVNEALNVFNSCIKEAADCMRKEIRVNKNKCYDWYDSECRASKRNVRKLLKKFRHTIMAQDRDCFCKARREYKNLLKRKKKQFNDVMLNELVTSIKIRKFLG